MVLDQLLMRMASFSDRESFVWRDASASYAQLLESVHQWQQRLADDAIPLGAVVAVEGEFQPSAYTLLLGLLQHRAIVVPLSAATPEVQRATCLGVAQAEHRFRCNRNGECAYTCLTRHAAAHPLIQRLRQERRGGFVLFTSGSTGEPKAVLHDAEKLLSKFLTATKQFRTLAFFPFDHIAGLDTCWYALASGSTLIGCEERTPEAVCQLIERHRVEVLPTSPSFLTLLLLSEAHERCDLSSLKIITYGSEPMPESTLRKLHGRFPQVKLMQKYGMCEVGSPRSKSQSSESLWMKVDSKGFHTKVVNGTLWIKADTAMLGYLNAPSPFDAEGWLNTEDRVEVHGEYVRFLGRQSDIINVGGAKVYPAEVEEVLLQLDNIARVTVMGEAHPLMGQIVVAKVSLVQPEDVASVKRRIRTFCQGRLAPHQMPVKVDIVGAPAVSQRFKTLRR